MMVLEVEGTKENPIPGLLNLGYLYQLAVNLVDTKQSCDIN